MRIVNVLAIDPPKTKKTVMKESWPVDLFLKLSKI